MADTNAVPEVRIDPTFLAAFSAPSQQSAGTPAPATPPKPAKTPRTPRTRGVPAAPAALAAANTTAVAGAAAASVAGPIAGLAVAGGMVAGATALALRQNRRVRRSNKNRAIRNQARQNGGGTSPSAVRGGKWTGSGGSSPRVRNAGGGSGSTGSGSVNPRSGSRSGSGGLGPGSGGGRSGGGRGPSGSDLAGSGSGRIRSGSGSGSGGHGSGSGGHGSGSGSKIGQHGSGSGSKIGNQRSGSTESGSGSGGLGSRSSGHGSGSTGSDSPRSRRLERQRSGSNRTPLLFSRPDRTSVARKVIGPRPATGPRSERGGLINRGDGSRRRPFHSIGNGIRATRRGATRVANGGRRIGRGARSTWRGAKAVGRGARSTWRNAKALSQRAKSLGRGAQAIGRGARRAWNGAQSACNGARRAWNARPTRAARRWSLGAARRAWGIIGPAVGSMLAGVHSAMKRRGWRDTLKTLATTWGRLRAKWGPKKGKHAVAAAAATPPAPTVPAATVARPAHVAATPGGPPAFTGGVSTVQARIIEASREMVGAAMMYTPEGMMQIGNDFASFPEVIRNVANAIQQMTSQVQSGETPMNPAIVDHLRALHAGLMKTAHEAEDLKPAFENLHAVDISRIRTPRPGEEMWDLAKNRDYVGRS